VTRRTIDDLLAESRRGVRRLEPREAYDEMGAGAKLVDTRSADLLARDGRIPGAIELPLSVLEWRVDPASGARDARIEGPDDRIVLICAEGFSSSLAAARLRWLGFDRVTDVAGGFEAWKAAGLPTES
jgi:rhodanese-related sulfurtransferase